MPYPLPQTLSTSTSTVINQRENRPFSSIKGLLYTYASALLTFPPFIEMIRKKGQKDISLEHHQGIANCLRKGDYSDAKRLIKSHLRYVEDVVRNQVTKILNT